jgi:hypothetical protein
MFAPGEQENDVNYGRTKIDRIGPLSEVIFSCHGAKIVTIVNYVARGVIYDRSVVPVL